MPDPRLTFALELLGSGDWETFEHFAAEFLVIRFPDLRTTASPHGDRGRDGQLYVLDDEFTTAIQYSVAKDWDAKIRKTVKTLKGNFNSIDELIYATSQQIGPDADALKTHLWKTEGVVLDICDRSWFAERQSTAPQRIAASEELIALKVRPMLASRRLDDSPAELTGDEGRLALLHLALDSDDNASQKGLTKRSFEALTLAALHGTNVETAIEKQEVVARVIQTLPAGHDQQVTALVEAALARLSRKRGPVNTIKGGLQFHLSFAEEKRLAEQTAQFLLDEVELEEQLLGELELAVDKEVTEGERDRVGSDLRTALESILLHKGELFAAATVTGVVEPILSDEIMRSIPNDQVPEGFSSSQVAAAATAVLERPLAGVRAHLRRLADAYTMFAFLRQTPDVQKVVVKIFSEGDVWLDTSVVLPLFAETLIDDPLGRPFSVMLGAAQDAGLRLHVTDGVVEEVERHLNRSKAFASMGPSRWRGRIPYIYATYSDAGRDRTRFAKWVEEFMGTSRPEDDVRDYLKGVLHINRQNLLEYSDAAPTELRGAVGELWAQVHDRRRSKGFDDWDQGTVYRLIAHDVENSVGVLQLRKRSEISGLGYRHWWLTLDRAAFKMDRHLKAQLGKDAPMSPALSPDYLVQVLRIGSMRTAIETDRRVNLPLLADFSRLDATPRELIEAADTMRAEAVDTGEHVIRRRVRDEMDARRATYSSQSFERSLREIGGESHADVEVDEDGTVVDRS